MSENKFIDRKSEFPNRRKIDVVSCTVDGAGSIESMLVDILRTEEERNTVTGTELNAESMNTIVIESCKTYLDTNLENKVNLINEHFFNNVVKETVFKMVEPFYVDYYETSPNNMLTMTQIKNQYQTVSIKINLPKGMLYAGVIKYDNFINSQVNYYENYINVKILETNVLNRTTNYTTDVHFEIELYLDQNQTYCVAKLPYVLRYYASSTNPTD